ncbi:MAG: polysaccharide biosynthesis protein, partial [Spirochaetales bacterium]|nr:polysaccharide biosynthesis protein [Spirochaetales bacterium]
RPVPDEAILAIPSATKGQLKKIYDTLVETGIPRIRILPAISQIVDGEAHFVLTREIDPQDLLGRNPVQISLRQSLRYLRGKRVLITGAGGSIGGELARQLLSGGAERLYILGHGENSIYQIDKELRVLQSGGVGEKATIVPIVADLKDPHHIQFLLERLKADVIFHTAAHKHVPMMEANPVEACSNNVFGTKNLLDAALKAGVKRFVLISTDKAVEPNSVYGVTKRIGEDLVLDANSRGNGQYMVVRFGNVLGSRGSIIPLFREQILSGGPVTITDKRATRYFMTIPEAASLVLQTGGVGQGGHRYLLDMGEPVVIEDLAMQIMRFYGKQPHKDVAIQYIGLRPGEKISEHLYGPDEEPVPTSYARINRLVSRTDPEGSAVPLKTLLENLGPVCFFHPEQASFYRNRRTLRALLRQAYPTLEDKDEPEF